MNKNTYSDSGRELRFSDDFDEKTITAMKKAENSNKARRRFAWIYGTAAACVLVVVFGVFVSHRPSANMPDIPSATSNETDTNGNIESNMINNADSENDLSIGEPPRILTFRSMNDYKTFVDSPELSDEEFNAFISQNSYNMNGVSTKDDVIAFCNKLNSIPFPEAHELTFSAMQLYIESNHCDLFFKYSGNVNCVFEVYLDTSKGTESIINAGKIVGTIKPVTATSDEIQELYRFENTDEDREAYYAVINNYLVLFRTFGATSEQAQSIINTATYTTLQSKYRVS